MSAHLITAVFCFLLALGVFILSKHFRLFGQHMLDTLDSLENGFLIVPREFSPSYSHIWARGHDLRLAGLIGYIVTAGVFYFAAEFMFRASAESLGDDLFMRLSTTNGDLVVAIILLCQVLGFFWIAQRLSLMGTELPRRTRNGQIFSFFGLLSYFIAGSVLVFAILVPVYGRILLHVSSSP